MKNALLSLSLFVAFGIFALQVPIGGALQQVAGVASAGSYGTRLGQTVHDVVLNIRAQDKARGEKSYITHAHVMAVMCQENPKLKGNIRNGEGRYEGLTQVIDSTWRGLLKGRMAKGQCRYINKLERGVCSAPGARISNPRCSIEIGACLYNYELKRVRGNAALAYNAYNTGTSRKRANGLADFVRGYNASRQGRLCAKARYNASVWRAMRVKISALTGGKFKTDDAQHIAASSAGWPSSPRSVPTINNIGKNWWSSPAGQRVAKGAGQLGQGYAQGAQQAEQQQKQQQQEQARRAALQQVLQRRKAAKPSWLDRLLGKEPQISTATSTPQVTSPAQATLACHEQNATTVRLEWSCPGGTTVSRGFATNGAVFKTRGAGSGIATSRRVVGAEYILQCINGHRLGAEARCIVNTRSATSTRAGTEQSDPPQDSIPNGVIMSIEYDNGSLIWATLGTQSCTVQAGNISEDGKSGEVRLGRLAQSTLVRLKCQTSKGTAIKYKQLRVR